MAPSVLREAGFACRRAKWRLSSEAHRLDPLGADSYVRQILSNHDGASIAKREVVFRSPTLVAMAVDADLGLWPFHEPLRVSLKDLAGIVAQGVLVVIEEDVVEWLRRVQLIQRHTLEQL